MNSSSENMRITSKSIGNLLNKLINQYPVKNAVNTLKSLDLGQSKEKQKKFPEEFIN